MNTNIDVSASAACAHLSATIRVTGYQRVMWRCRLMLMLLHLASWVAPFKCNLIVETGVE